MLDEMKKDAAATDDAEPTGVVMALAREMETLRDRKADLEEELRGIRERYDEVRKELLPDAMQAAGMVSDAGKGSFTTPTHRVHLRQDVKAYVRKADRERFHDWLRDNGHGALIKEGVHHGTLRSFAREQRAEGADLPGELNIHDEIKAVIVKK